jgi:hypothetical protein
MQAEKMRRVIVANVMAICVRLSKQHAPEHDDRNENNVKDFAIQLRQDIAGVACAGGVGDVWVRGQ